MAVTVFYERLTVPAGTTLAAPVEQTLHCAPGTLKLLRLYVPPGPRGELSLWLLHQRSQIAPVPPSTWDNLDDAVVEYPLDLTLFVNETDLVLVGASPEANFSHAVDFEALVETEARAALPSQPGSLGERILSILGG